MVVTDKCLLQAIDHIINSAAKSNYMSAGQISVPIVFRGPNGAAAGVGAQHSQVWGLLYDCWEFETTFRHGCDV